MLMNPMDQATQALWQLGQKHDAARAAAEEARRELKRAVRSHLAAGTPEATVARLAGVDRMTVRKWRRQDV